MDHRNPFAAPSTANSLAGEAANQRRDTIPRPHAPLLRVDEPHVDEPESPPAARPPRRDSQILLEASTILQQLQQELSEQDRREAAIAAREAEFEEQKEGFERWATRIRAELEERREALLTSESAIATRLASLDDRLSDVSRERDTLQAEFAERAEQQQQWQAAVVEQTTAERALLLEMRQQLANDLAKLDLERSLFTEQQLTAAEQAEASLAEERQALCAALAQEWQKQREQLDEERAIAQAEAEQETREAALSRRQYEQALLGLETQLANRRAAVEAELSGLRQQVETELSEQRAQWEQVQQTRQHEQQRERSLLETRLRFQQEHLEKVRLELEAQQDAFRFERQQLRQQLEGGELQLERRKEQLRLFQQSIEEQAASIDRERETLLKCREAWDSTVDADRAAFEAEQVTWKDERHRQQIELQRQREAMASHSESLERKRTRLERLRSELEETHRATLELRLAVEESWAQIADTLGSEEDARLRVDQSRQTLVVYYQELHAAIGTQREEILDQHLRLDQQRLAFHEERQTLMKWLVERDEQLRVEESRLQQSVAASSAREAEWSRSRDRWLAEKLEAEALIRRLLKELGRDESAVELLGS